MTTHLRIHSLHFVFLQLKLHKIVDHMEQFGRHGFEVLVVIVLDGQGSEYGVVDKRRTQVGQHARGVLPGVFVKVLSNEVV